MKAGILFLTLLTLATGAHAQIGGPLPEGNASNQNVTPQLQGRDPGAAISDLFNRVQAAPKRSSREIEDLLGRAFPDARKSAYSHMSVTRVSLDHTRRSLSVPSISMVQAGGDFDFSEDLFLDDWEAETIQGRTFISSHGDPASRIEVSSGLVLGEYGRVLAVMLSKGVPLVILESGDEISGRAPH